MPRRSCDRAIVVCCPGTDATEPFPHSRSPCAGRERENCRRLSPSLPKSALSSLPPLSKGRQLVTGKSEGLREPARTFYCTPLFARRPPLRREGKGNIRPLRSTRSPAKEAFFRSPPYKSSQQPKKNLFPVSPFQAGPRGERGSISTKNHSRAALTHGCTVQ